MYIFLHIYDVHTPGIFGQYRSGPPRNGPRWAKVLLEQGHLEEEPLPWPGERKERQFSYDARGKGIKTKENGESRKSSGFDQKLCPLEIHRKSKEGKRRKFLGLEIWGKLYIIFFVSIKYMGE